MLIDRVATIFMTLLRFSALTLTTSTLLLGKLPTVRGMCTYTLNSPDASAKQTLVGSGSFFSYSCTPCVHEDYEAHVLNVYQPYGTENTQPILNNIHPVTVAFEAANPTDIKLMLISHKAAHWVVIEHVNVTIRQIVLVSNYKSYITFIGTSSTSITTDDEYINGWESTELADFVTKRFGFLSSYTGVYETSAWTLKVGECILQTDNLTPTSSDLGKDSKTTQKQDYLTTPASGVVKSTTTRPRRAPIIPIIKEPERSNIGQSVIFIVFAAIVVVSFGIAGRVICKKDFPNCRSYCLSFCGKCGCFLGDQTEEQIQQQPSLPLLSEPSAPLLTSLEQTTPSAPPPESPVPVMQAPPAYGDAINYPRPETPPPTYVSV